MGNKTNIITIEKNIPIPELRFSGGRERYTFLKKMEIGDSFYINGSTPDITPKGVRQYVYGEHFKKHGRRYTVRTMEGGFVKPKAIRVWRVR